MVSRIASALLGRGLMEDVVEKSSDVTLHIAQEPFSTICLQLHNTIIRDMILRAENI